MARIETNLESAWLLARLTHHLLPHVTGRIHDKATTKRSILGRRACGGEANGVVTAQSGRTNRVFPFSQNAGHSSMKDPLTTSDPEFVPDMNAPDNLVPVYIDQNTLSHLRDGKNAREELIGLLRTLKEQSAVFVFTMAHVDDCRASSQPETFVQAMEELPVYLTELQNASDQQAFLSLGRARELLLGPEDPTHQAMRLTENLLHVFHYASGWLGKTEAQELKNEMAAEIAVFWETLLNDLDWDLLTAEFGVHAKCALSAGPAETGALLENLPFEQIQDKWKKAGWD